MSDVDWTGVPAPEPEPEPDPKSPIPGLLGFTVVLIGLLAGGGAMVNLTMFGNRIKQRAIDDCDGPACVLEVRTAHDDCYADGLAWSVPSGVAAFQTPPEANTFGALSIDYAAYKQCAGFDKPKTLDEAEATGE